MPPHSISGGGDSSRSGRKNCACLSSLHPGLGRICSLMALAAGLPSAEVRCERGTVQQEGVSPAVCARCKNADSGRTQTRTPPSFYCSICRRDDSVRAQAVGAFPGRQHTAGRTSSRFAPQAAKMVECLAGCMRRRCRVQANRPRNREESMRLSKVRERSEALKVGGGCEERLSSLAGDHLRTVADPEHGYLQLRLDPLRRLRCTQRDTPGVAPCIQHEVR